MSKKQEVQDLYDQMSQCTRCPRLVETRKQVVRGRGDPDLARIIIVGEAPGPDENEDGEAFIGRSGRKLDSIIATLGHGDGFTATADDFYMANSCACWPAQKNMLTDPPKLETAKPSLQELANCRSWLHRLIRIIDPIALILAGEYACTSFGLKKTIGKLQGNMVDVLVDGVTRQVIYCAMPVYHPAYLLRSADKPELTRNTERAFRAVVDRAWAYLRTAQGMSPLPAE